MEVSGDGPHGCAYKCFFYIPSEFFSSPPTAQPHPKPSSRRETQRQPVSAGLVPRGHQKLPWSEDHQLHHILEERAGLLRSAAPLQTRRDVRNLPAHGEILPDRGFEQLWMGMNEI